MRDAKLGRVLSPEGWQSLDVWIARREQQIHEARMRRMRYWGTPLPLYNLTVTMRTSSGETLTYEAPTGALLKWVPARFALKGAK